MPYFPSYVWRCKIVVESLKVVVNDGFDHVVVFIHPFDVLHAERAHGESAAGQLGLHFLRLGQGSHLVLLSFARHLARVHQYRVRDKVLQYYRLPLLRVLKHRYQKVESLVLHLTALLYLMIIGCSKKLQSAEAGYVADDFFSGIALESDVEEDAFSFFVACYFDYKDLSMQIIVLKRTLLLP